MVYKEEIVLKCVIKMNKIFYLFILFIALFSINLISGFSTSPENPYENYKYKATVTLSETAGIDRTNELVIVKSPPIDVSVFKIEYISGPSSSKHGGVAYIRDLRVVDGKTLKEIPSQTGDIVFYPNNTITFNIYFLVNISKNSHNTYHIYFGAKDVSKVNDPLKEYKTDLIYRETKTGGVCIENGFYNVTVDSSLGGWITNFIHKAGSGTKYTHGDSGGGVFIFYKNIWYSQVFNTKKIEYRICALGPIAVHVEFWGPIVDTAKRDRGICEYHTTWIFTANSPRIILIQNATLKTVIKANDFRPIEFYVPSFNWYDFYILQSDRTIYQGSVTKTVDKGGLGVDFNNAFWEIDVTKNHPEDAVAVIPMSPVFDFVKEHWYNIGCLDYVKNTRNPDTKTQVFGPGTYENPMKFFIIIDNAERMLKDNYKEIYLYEKMLKQPLILKTEFPMITVRRITYAIYTFKVIDIGGRPVKDVLIISDEDRNNITDANGIAYLNLTLGRRMINIYWSNLSVGSLHLVASPGGENITVKINIAIIDNIAIGSNGTFNALPTYSDKKILLNLSTTPNTLILCKVVNLEKTPTAVKINGITGASGYDFLYSDKSLTIYAVSDAKGNAIVEILFIPETIIPFYAYLIIIILGFIVLSTLSLIFYLRGGKYEK